MLRREAEELKRQMEQLQRGDTSPQQSGQQQARSQQGQQGQPGQQGQSSSRSSSQSAQSGQQGQMSRDQQQQQQRQLARRQQPLADPRLQEAINHLAQAEDDMRQAASAQQSGSQDQSTAGQRRAADKLRQAQDVLNGMERQQSGQSLDDMVKQAEQLSSHQQDFANRLRQTYSSEGANNGNPYYRQQGQPSPQTERLAQEKEKMADDLRRLEHQMQSTAGQTRDAQPGVSSKLRDALGDAQQNELDLRMRKAAEMLRQGQGMLTWVREAYVTQGLDKLRDQLKETQALAQGKGQTPAGKDPNKSAAERALARVEDARNRLEQLAQARQRAARSERTAGSEWRAEPAWTTRHPSG